MLGIDFEPTRLQLRVWGVLGRPAMARSESSNPEPPLRRAGRFLARVGFCLGSVALIYAALPFTRPVAPVLPGAGDASQLSLRPRAEARSPAAPLRSGLIEPEATGAVGKPASRLAVPLVAGRHAYVRKARWRPARIHRGRVRRPAFRTGAPSLRRI